MQTILDFSSWKLDVPQFFFCRQRCASVCRDVLQEVSSTPSSDSPSENKDELALVFGLVQPFWLTGSDALTILPSIMNANAVLQVCSPECIADFYIATYPGCPDKTEMIRQAAEAA